MVISGTGTSERVDCICCKKNRELSGRSPFAYFFLLYLVMILVAQATQCPTER
jgi:hypothetical protein